jgi:hypothetical protein
VTEDRLGDRTRELAQIACTQTTTARGGRLSLPAAHGPLISPALMGNVQMIMHGDTSHGSFSQRTAGR